MPTALKITSKPSLFLLTGYDIFVERIGQTTICPRTELTQSNDKQQRLDGNWFPQKVLRLPMGELATSEAVKSNGADLQTGSLKKLGTAVFFKP